MLMSHVAGTSTGGGRFALSQQPPQAAAAARRIPVEALHFPGQALAISATIRGTIPSIVSWSSGFKYT